MNKRFRILTEKYFSGELEAGEQEELDNYLRKPECAAYFERSKLAEVIIRAGFRKMQERRTVNDPLLEEMTEEELREVERDIEEYRSGHYPEIEARVRGMHRRMVLRRRRKVILSGAAAAVAAVLVVFFSLNGRHDPQRLYGRFFKPYDYLLEQEMRGAVSLYKEAVLLYKEGRYAESLALSRQNLELPDPGAEEYFLYGLNLLQADSIPQAAYNLRTASRMIEDKESEYYLAANWYLSMAYLKLAEVDSAVIYLRKIEGVERMFGEGFEVGKVLERLESL
jgi:hypothetical protein